MRKILTIAIREYRAMVATKAFLISIVMMPLLMLGGLIAMQLMQKAGTVSERKIAVFDPDGAYFEALSTMSREANRLMSEAASAADNSKNESSAEKDSESRQIEQQRKEVLGMSQEKYVFERIEGNEYTQEMGLELSRKIEAQELYAFLIIPENLAEPAELSKLAGEGANSVPKVLFHSQDASLSEAKRWISEVLNFEVRKRRFQSAKLDPAVIQQLSIPVPVMGMDLVKQATDGTLAAKEENNPLSAIFLPMGVMMMMFMVIFMAAQPMLESVLEEKSQRIAEVLLGSASPFQLMSGKLLGTVAGSLTIFLMYLVGGWLMATNRGWADAIPLNLIPWFIVFQVLGVLFYASIFLAVGASVSQLKEAQSLLLPVWMLMMSPMFIWIFIVRDPLGPVATYFSLFPPATPTAMMLRLATGQTIPIWQPILGSFLLLITTFVIVVLAGRIFRVGILWQGKSPKLTEIIRWAITG